MRLVQSCRYTYHISVTFQAEIGQNIVLACSLTFDLYHTRFVGCIGYVGSTHIAPCFRVQVWYCQTHVRYEENLSWVILSWVLGKSGLSQVWLGLSIGQVSVEFGSSLSWVEALGVGWEERLHSCFGFWNRCFGCLHPVDCLPHCLALCLHPVDCLAHCLALYLHPVHCLAYCLAHCLAPSTLISKTIMLPCIALHCPALPLSAPCTLPCKSTCTQYMTVDGDAADGFYYWPSFLTFGCKSGHCQVALSKGLCHHLTCLPTHQSSLLHVFSDSLCSLRIAIPWHTPFILTCSP